MTPISVVIITYNEEKNIERCLDSVRDVADEIVVLDSFSTDRTEEICKSRGVKFFQHKFDGHIEQKNRAITYSSNPYILSLDADEALDETLIKSILEVKKNWASDGYSMNRLTNYCGTWIHHCGWYPDRKLRLWDSRKGKWDGINPHDMYVMNKDAGIKHLKGDILHYSYYTREDHYKQVEYFTDISSKAFWKAGKRVGVVKLYLSPVVKFIRDYIVKLGFLDGSAGFTISRISAYATFLKYKKLRKLQETNGADNS
jgi:glycosyltransferase involved in cell wall biosynthesis